MQNRYFFRLLAALLLAAPLSVLAQTGSIGIGTTAPNAKAALDIAASDKGILIPRLDSVARVAISSPPQGLIVYQTDGRAGLWYYEGGWQLLQAVSTPVSASNGLTRTAGGTLQLGGVLNQPTTIAADTLGLTVTSRSRLPEAIDQAQAFGNIRFASPGEEWQSFTAGTSGQLTKVLTEVFLTAPTDTLTLNLYAGQGLGGLLLYTTRAGFTLAQSGYLTWTLPPGIGVVSGQEYTIGLTSAGANSAWHTGPNAYVGGVSSFGSGRDFVFATYVAGTTPPQAATFRQGTLSLEALAGTGTRVLTVDATGKLLAGADTAALGDDLGNHIATRALNLGPHLLTGGGAAGVRILPDGKVGIGTTAPTQPLEVAGQIYTTTGGIRFPDNTVQTSAVTNQTLNLSGQSLSISGGNTVTLPGDNLGNHTATQNLNLGAHTLVGTAAVNVGSAVSLNDREILLRGANASDVNHGLGWYGAGKDFNGLSIEGPALYGLNGGVLGTFNSPSLRRIALYWNNFNRVGINTTQPSTQLDVDGGVRIRSLTAAGFVRTDASGNLSRVDAPVSEGTTASNGLTLNGLEVRLGGQLSSATTIGTTDANPLTIAGSGAVNVGTGSGAVNVGNPAGATTINGGSINLIAATTMAATSITGTTAIRGTTTINGGTSTSATNIGTSATAGAVTIGRPNGATSVNGTVTLGSLTGTGTRVVTTDAGGNLNSATLPITESTTASNGLTRTGTNVALGGTLTGATSIAQGGHALTFTNGRVGIGTSATPSYPLTIQAAGPDLLLFRDNLGTDKWHWNLSSSSLNLAETGQADGRLFMESGGNVGLGTTDPNTTLDVNGGLTLREGTATIGVGATTITVGNRTYIRVSSPGPFNTAITLTNGLQTGQMLLLECAAGTFSIVDTNQSGNINTGGNRAFGVEDTILLVWNGNRWVEIIYENN